AFGLGSNAPVAGGNSSTNRTTSTANNAPATNGNSTSTAAGRPGNVTTTNASQPSGANSTDRRYSLIFPPLDFIASFRREMSTPEVQSSLNRLNESLTDLGLFSNSSNADRVNFLSVGMSNLEQIGHAIEQVGQLQQSIGSELEVFGQSVRGTLINEAERMQVVDQSVRLKRATRKLAQIFGRLTPLMNFGSDGREIRIINSPSSSSNSSSNSSNNATNNNNTSSSSVNNANRGQTSTTSTSRPSNANTTQTNSRESSQSNANSLLDSLNSVVPRLLDLLPAATSIESSSTRLQTTVSQLETAISRINESPSSFMSLGSVLVYLAERMFPERNQPLYPNLFDDSIISSDSPLLKYFGKNITMDQLISILQGNNEHLAKLKPFFNAWFTEIGLSETLSFNQIKTILDRYCRSIRLKLQNGLLPIGSDINALTNSIASDFSQRLYEFLFSIYCVMESESDDRFSRTLRTQFNDMLYHPFISDLNVVAESHNIEIKTLLNAIFTPLLEHIFPVMAVGISNLITSSLDTQTAVSPSRVSDESEDEESKSRLKKIITTAAEDSNLPGPDFNLLINNMDSIIENLIDDFKNLVSGSLNHQ
ncbi:hypothetical protein ROZALSC1DRAFT_29200, partial [Rozella allomycis CSF55]